MVARLDAGNPGTDILHHRPALVTEDGGENPFRVLPRQGISVGVADAAGDHAQQDLAGPRAFNVHHLDAERLAGLPGNRSTCFHLPRSSVVVVAFSMNCRTGFPPW